MDVGTNLKQILRKEDITLRKLSRDLEIDPGYLSKVLNGKVQPTFRWTGKIFDHLGYTIEFKKKGGEKSKKNK